MSKSSYNYIAMYNIIICIYVAIQRHIDIIICQISLIIKNKGDTIQIPLNNCLVSYIIIESNY